MATDKTTLRFWLRTDRPNKDGSSPIHLVYQIQGQRKYSAIPGIKLYSINWNVKDQQAVYLDKKSAKKLDPVFKPELLLSNAEVNDINLKLSGITKDVNDVEAWFKAHKAAFSPQMVIDRLKEVKQPETKKDQPGTFIVDFTGKFINETTEHREGTLKEYKGLMNHMKDYEQVQKVKFTFEGDASILKGFSNYLTNDKEINNITKAKHISTFKTILRHAKKPPYKIKSNPDYFEFSIKRKDGEFEVIALTEEELQAIYDLDLSKNKPLDEARDIFVFSCATALRYGDLAQLRWQHIRKDNTIQMTSGKNDKKIEVPLIPISHAILQKYSDRPFPLPVTARQKLISNQKLNDNIKKVGKLAGIDSEIEVTRPYGLKMLSLGVFKKWELLSIHVGRKTFTSLSLARGIAIHEVMKITTHSSFKAVQRYIDVTKSQKKAVMAKAYGEVPKSNLKAV